MTQSRAADFKHRKQFQQTFNALSLGVFNFLQDHDHVDEVKLFERPGVSRDKIEEWEKLNHPFKLPQDYVDFLTLSEGMLLKWCALHRDETIPLGCMHLNPLSSVTALEAELPTMGELDGISETSEKESKSNEDEPKEERGEVILPRLLNWTVHVRTDALCFCIEQVSRIQKSGSRILVAIGTLSRLISFITSVS